MQTLPVRRVRSRPSVARRSYWQISRPSFAGFAPEGTGCGQCLVTGTLASSLVGSALAQVRALRSRLQLKVAGGISFLISGCYSLLAVQVSILQIGALAGSSAFAQRGIREASAHLAPTITTRMAGCEGRALSVPTPLLL
jgi:hypothetical protein